MTTTSSAYRSAIHRVRPFRPGDREGILSLYRTVFGGDPSAEWFAWKYEDNPYAVEVPVVVATFDGEVVGCRAFFALEMAVDGDPCLALQPCDTMVHPDHRRRGLFVRMNRFAVDRYAERPPAFCFNFPNDSSKPGNEAVGWRPVGRVPMYYRVTDPAGALAALAGSGDRAASTSRASSSSGPVADAVGVAHRAGDRLLAPSSHRIRCHESPPIATLAALYGQAPPTGIHAVRSERFYRWRLANPERRYHAYVAARGGEPVAAVVVSPAPDHVRIVDAVPREGALDARRDLLAAVCREYADRSYVTAFGAAVDEPLWYRFLPDTRPPLSTVIRPTTRTLYARDLGSEAVEGRSITGWTLTRLALDTA